MTYKIHSNGKTYSIEATSPRHALKIMQSGLGNSDYITETDDILFFINGEIPYIIYKGE